MKNFFIDSAIFLFSGLFLYPAVAFVLFLFHRENDVSGFSMYCMAVGLAYVLMKK